MTGFSLKEIANRFRTGIYQSSEVDSALALKTNSADLVSAIGNINSPLLDMPLKNNLAMKAGVGSATFTRASTATYIDRYGVLKTAAVDEPRFEKEGYLNEGASTNLLTYSEQCDNTIWVKSRTTVSVNTADTRDPYGTNLADKVIEDTTASATHAIQNGYTFTSGVVYTASIFLKAGERDIVSISGGNTTTFAANCQFNLTTGVVVSQTLGSASIKSVGNGWYRCSITGTAGATGSTGVVVFLTQNGATTYTGDGVSGIYVFGAQLEALPFATSYIPTTSATVTRSADILYVTKYNNISKPYDELSVLVDFSTFDTRLTGVQYIWSTSGTTSTARRNYINNTNKKRLVNMLCSIFPQK